MRTMLFAALVFAVCVQGLPAQAGEPPVECVEMGLTQYNAEAELGHLFGCAYRLVKEGTPEEFLSPGKRKMKLVVAKKETDLGATLFVAEGDRKGLTRDDVLAMISEADAQCYERMQQIE